MPQWLSFTHILQMDFVKGPEERIIIADRFANSTVLIHSIGDPQKMWVRIRPQWQGSSGSERDKSFKRPALRGSSPLRGPSKIMTAGCGNRAVACKSFRPVK